MSVKELYLNLYKASNAELEERAKRAISDYYHIPKEYLDKIKICYKKLPCKIIIDRNDWFPVSLSALLGHYDKKRKKIYIEKNLPNDAKFLTLLHEFVHAVQDYYGKYEMPNKESSRKLEREAKDISAHLFIREFCLDAYYTAVENGYACAKEKIRKCNFLKKFLYYILRIFVEPWLK
jgi:Zn-dependent peptidase ImmA (M78 family)